LEVRRREELEQYKERSSSSIAPSSEEPRRGREVLLEPIAGKNGVIRA
jgi:hypothetical protein